MERLSGLELKVKSAKVIDSEGRFGIINPFVALPSLFD